MDVHVSCPFVGGMISRVCGSGVPVATETLLAERIAASMVGMRFSMITAVALSVFFHSAGASPVLEKGSTILFYGNSMMERLCEYGELEALVQLAKPESDLHFRSLAWTGDEVGHRQRPEGYAEHLKNLLALWPANVVVVGFGMNESFAGASGLDAFQSQYEAFLRQVSKQHPKATLVLLGPTAVEGASSPRGVDAVACDRYCPS